jgi:hypothetical protein
MKKNAIALIVSLVIIAVFGTGVFAQTYAVPREVPIERIVRKTFPNYFGRGNRYPALIPEKFFPIGWSRDGKLAYYIEPVDEACGCYYAKLVIQDLRADKVIWEFKYTQDEQTDAKGNMTGPGDIRKLWAKNRKLFSDKLAENGIVVSRFAMLGKNFTHGGRSYTAKSTVKMGKNPEEDWDRVNNFDISLGSPRLGSKNVYSADFTKEEYWFMLDARLVGTLMSPYENRVALVAVEVMRGYEGPPHTGDIRIVGADLKSGFGRNLHGREDTQSVR